MEDEWDEISREAFIKEIKNKAESKGLGAFTAAEIAEMEEIVVEGERMTARAPDPTVPPASPIRNLDKVQSALEEFWDEWGTMTEPLGPLTTAAHNLACVVENYLA